MILELLFKLLDPLPKSKVYFGTESLFLSNSASMLLMLLRRGRLSFIKEKECWKK